MIAIPSSSNSGPAPSQDKSFDLLDQFPRRAMQNDDQLVDFIIFPALSVLGDLFAGA